MKLKASKWLTAALVLVFSSAFFAQSTSYPPSRGAVSDYAGKLSQPQVAELTSLILDYRRQTSIEIVVVVVDSLQGQSAREYATGIGNSWGVGKADRNNGIVLLWAPNERAYSLRIADGLSQDLSDADATAITRTAAISRKQNGDRCSYLHCCSRYADIAAASSTTAISREGNRAWCSYLQCCNRYADIAATTGTTATTGTAAAISRHGNRSLCSYLQCRSR